MKKDVYSVSEFKARSLGILERIAKAGSSVTITKRGQPIAKVISIGQANETRPQPGRLQGTVLEEKDVVTPLGPEMWQAAGE